MVRFGLWPLRALWLGLPLVAGGTLSGALDDVSATERGVAAVGAWIGWAGVLLATSVPRTASLTTVRIGAPAALATALWAASRDGGAISGAIGAAWAAATLAVAVAAPVADAFVDGSSYGPERRFALRTPAPLLLGPVPATVVLVAAGVAVGPLLLGAGAVIPGLLTCALGAPVAWLAARALHQLSRRWVVFVPAGVVLHDPLALGDPVLFRRQAVARIGPAPAIATAPGTDLTGSAPGLVLELALHAATTVVLADRTRGRRRAEPVRTDRLLFTPLRPGAVLAEAAARRLPVG